MSLHWYACISTNTYCFEIYHISLETNWWALPNASLIMRICLAIHEILADKAFTATDILISQSFVVAFVHPTYVRIVLIWGFLAQLGLWKSVHWLRKYKLNEVCDITPPLGSSSVKKSYMLFWSFWRFSWNFYFAFSKFSSYSYIFSSWLNLFHQIRLLLLLFILPDLEFGLVILK